MLKRRDGNTAREIPNLWPKIVSWEDFPAIRMRNLLSEPEVGQNPTLITHTQIF